MEKTTKSRWKTSERAYVTRPTQAYRWHNPSHSDVPPKLISSLRTVRIKTLTGFINKTDALIIELRRKQRPRIATTHAKELPRGHDFL